MAPVEQVLAPSVPFREALRSAIAELQASDVPSAALAAELLLMHVVGYDRGYIYSHPEGRLAGGLAARYFALVAERATGKPTQYITGHQEFWGLDFEVTPDVLIPRPETEHLVEAVLELVRAGASGKAAAARGKGAGVRILDVGTGSGCIALALASEVPEAEIFATDLSRPALSVAERNARRLGLAGRVHFVETDLAEGLWARSVADGFDFVVSNPPYVGAGEIGSVQREVREFEPRIAWGGTGTGLEIYGRLIPQALAALRPDGWLGLEVGYTQAEAVRALLDESWFEKRIRPDLAGVPRVVMARKVNLNRQPAAIDARGEAKPPAES